MRSTPANPPRRGSIRNSNSLQAQREACEAFISSQRHEGWVCLPAGYDDGGFSGVAMDRPALQRRLRTLVAEFERGARSFDPDIVLKTGTTLVRQWRGHTHTVLVGEEGFEYEGIAR